MAVQEMILDEEGTSVAIRRFKQNPFLVVGVTGFLMTLAAGAYKYRTRPKDMSTALFLVQLRVAAQSAVIGSLSIGMIYGMLSKYVFKSGDTSKPN